MLATKNGKIVAVKGDPAAPVNRGLNCIKGYFNAKIMYGADRLTILFLESMKRVSLTRRVNLNLYLWQRAFDEMEKHAKKGSKRRKDQRGLLVFGLWDHITR